MILSFTVDFLMFLHRFFVQGPNDLVLSTVEQNSVVQLVKKLRNKDKRMSRMTGTIGRRSLSRSVTAALEEAADDSISGSGSLPSSPTLETKKGHGSPGTEKKKLGSSTREKKKTTLVNV